MKAHDWLLTVISDLEIYAKENKLLQLETVMRDALVAAQIDVEREPPAAFIISG